MPFPLLLSLQTALAATLLVLPIGLIVAWRLGVGKPFRGRVLVETVLTLPLVLPPTVAGFALLLVLGRGSAFGRWLNDGVGVRLLFTWEGAAVAAGVMAFPLFVRTATAALSAVDRDLIEVGRTLGATEWAILWRVIGPLAYRGLIAATTLSFARALGEFGATLIVAGNIPGRTQTLPLALYDAVQAGRQREAMLWAALLFFVAFGLLGAAGFWGGRIAAGRGED